MSQTGNLERQLAFLVEIDKLKTILRRNYVMHADRRENSAEHSWHLVMTALILAEHSNEPIYLDRVLRMLVIHDIVEVDAGDTFLYDTAGYESKVAREQQAADRIFGLCPADQGKEIRGLWDEFESRDTAESRFAYAVDRFISILHNKETRGKGWRENGVTKSQVLKFNKGIADGSIVLWDWVQHIVDQAAKEGILPET
jgi:putative hydrolases of HD superfamily